MEVDPQATDAPEETAAILQLQLNLLSVIKSAQLQNGLKHGDYGRYRQYCARRLRSLYKALKFLHGKGRYTKKKLDVPQVSDARHLQILLVCAERAWAHAMLLKQESQQDGAAAAKKRHTALRRLRKASFWAGELSRIAGTVCDTRSAVEADAYAAWMSGNVLMETESDWQRALACYTRAKKLFTELARVGDPESQALCGAMAEELAPALRYCNYQISRAGGEAVDPAGLLALAEEGGEGGGSLLQSKLASLAAEAQTAQAAATSSFEWRGIKAPVSQERVRVPLHNAAELAATLEAAMDTDGPASAEQALPQHDKLTNWYQEARAATRNAIKAAQTGGGSGAAGKAGAEADAGDLEDLVALEKALSGRILEGSLARGEVAAADAAARFAAGLQRQAAGKAAGGGKGKERPAKPEDLVRLTTTLAQLAADLEEHASHLGGRQGEALAAAAAARGGGYAAWRAYYQGHVALAAAAAGGGRYAEAAGLFRRAGERAAAAQEATEELPKSESAAWAALPGLQQLAALAGSYLLVACAEAAAEGAAGAEGAGKGLEGLGLAGGAAQQASSALYLPDALDAWESFGGSGSGKGARLFQGPYALAAIRPRPIMLDSAAGEVDYPDVSHRVKRRKTAAAAAAGSATGTFARLFGGWGGATS
uniref:Signal recognition particle subunit SRP68 n=1 Tax=Tetradesmus obliquus TaxID=3088 RepID=A0A383WP02_TETOB|eukprot:jgi/Sobl393_1/6375/SZX78446.1